MLRLQQLQARVVQQMAIHIGAFANDFLQADLKKIEIGGVAVHQPGLPIPDVHHHRRFVKQRVGEGELVLQGMLRLGALANNPLQMAIPD